MVSQLPPNSPVLQYLNPSLDNLMNFVRDANVKISDKTLNNQTMVPLLQGLNESIMNAKRGLSATTPLNYGSEAGVVNSTSGEVYPTSGEVYPTSGEVNPVSGVRDTINIPPDTYTIENIIKNINPKDVTLLIKALLAEENRMNPKINQKKR